MSHLYRGDYDLHDENGEHIGTPPTADGHQLELYEGRIRRHLNEHAYIEAEVKRVFRSNDPADVDTTDGRL